jgi:hypothetical protein
MFRAYDRYFCESIFVIYFGVIVSFPGHIYGDQNLMANIITTETLAAFITMPIVLALMG